MLDTTSSEDKPEDKSGQSQIQDSIQTQPSPDPAEQVATPSTPAARSSWFGLWGYASPTSNTDPEPANLQKSVSVEPSHTNVDATSDSQDTSNISPRPTSGGWAFWSREKQTQSVADHGDVGEVAVANTSSESNPQPAAISAPSSIAGSTSKKRERPSSEEQSTSSPQKKTKELDEESKEPKESSRMHDSILKTTVDPSTSKRSTASPTKDLLLPAFDNTYHQAPTPSYLQKFIGALGRGHSQKQNHLNIAVHPHCPQKALAIGIHGYFPAPLIQKVLGQPTGTSLRFANGAADAITAWATKQSLTCDIEKIALEGEGMIADRIDSLWSLLLNWIDHIRKADFILLACHSQGVPVAISLVAKLLNFGCLKPSARIGVCGMAGVNLGPFSSYQSRFFGGSASELFDFSRPLSAVSKNYSSALALVLKHHVRIVYIGSIDDQLVSLESSTFSNISHPYIYRAVFVDGRIHAPDFLTHLVGFALKLRNLGISDHGLVRELSGPLAGSLYTGEGHSRIYEDRAVYALAVSHALETTTLASDANPTITSKPYQVPGATNTNPYFLPWAMRGVLEEDFVRTELKTETSTLLSLFEQWKPSSKVLKDVKFRLEAVKSKL